MRDVGFSQTENWQIFSDQTQNRLAILLAFVFSSQLKSQQLTNDQRTHTLNYFYLFSNMLFFIITIQSLLFQNQIHHNLLEGLLWRQESRYNSTSTLG